jgi:hypothetical protein
MKRINIFSFPYLNYGLHYYISIYDIGGLLYLSLMGFIISLIFMIHRKEKRDCNNCKFNKGDRCTVGTYHFQKYGTNEVCYNGELWEKFKN